MKTFSALSTGTSRVCSSPRVWFIFWFFQLLASAIVVAPLAAFLTGNPGRSLWSTELRQQLDAAWVVEALKYFHGAPVMSIMFSGVVALLLALLGQVLLAGGAIALYTDAEASYSVHEYYRNCGRYFWRFFRLLLIAFLFYALLVAFNAGLGKLADKIWGEGMEARPLVRFGYFRDVLAAALFLLINAVMDFAKVRIVAENRRSVCGAAVWAWRFVFRNLRFVVTLFVTLTVIGILLLFGYRGIEALLPRTNMGVIVLLIFAQQLFLLARIGLRLTFWASEAALYRDLNPPYRPAEIAPLSVMPESAT